MLPEKLVTHEIDWNYIDAKNPEAYSRGVEQEKKLVELLQECSRYDAEEYVLRFVPKKLQSVYLSLVKSFNNN